MKKAFISDRKTLYSGKFLALELLNYTYEFDRDLTWESAVRVNSTAAVMILPLIQPDDELLIIRQFRPPTGRYVWETPAGLIDHGEDPASAALRELAEETGFSGKITKILPPTFSSSGLSGESVYMAFAEIDGREFPPGCQLQTNFDDAENIATFRVKRTSLHKFLLDAIERGDGVDSKLLLYSSLVQE